MNNLIVHDYLHYLAQSPSAGLLITQDEALIETVSQCAYRFNFLPAFSWRDVLFCLSFGKSALVRLRHPISFEMYEIISQYDERAGRLEVKDDFSQDMKRVDFDPYESHLLLVTSREELKLIEAELPVREKIGLVEQVSYVS